MSDMRHDEDYWSTGTKNTRAFYFILTRTRTYVRTYVRVHVASSSAMNVF